MRNIWGSEETYYRRWVSWLKDPGQGDIERLRESEGGGSLGLVAILKKTNKALGTRLRRRGPGVVETIATEGVGIGKGGRR